MSAAGSVAALDRGIALEVAKRHDDAYACFLEATALDPDNGRAWRHLGDMLRRAKRLAEASRCFERAIDAGDDAALNTFFLSAVGVGSVVPAAPASFVAALYDDYAERFDAHLINDLRYCAPQLLAALIARNSYTAFDAALDLGCGTGLMGAALQPNVHRIDGVDLSAEMLAQALKTGIYDRLAKADLLRHLLDADRSYDLVVCCDSFIYQGDLQPVFAAVGRILRAGGSFAFSVESCGAELGYDLLPTLRYTHSEPYLRGLASAHGFRVAAVTRESLRVQDGVPVEGLLCHLVLG